VVLLVALCFLGTLLTAASGRFWDYHWFVFLYFVLLLSALCFVEQDERSTRLLRSLPIALLALAIATDLVVPREFLSQLGGEPPPRLERVEEIAAYLDENLRPGERVQPLDWTGGAVHAMLRARAPLATPFATDFYFYHHVSNPYIASLRQRFLSAFADAKPELVIEVEKIKPWPHGPDTTREFPALREILERDYRVVFEGRGYRILRRQPEG
jgi:hypothetical protein